jgi:flavodoxin
MNNNDDSAGDDDSENSEDLFHTFQVKSYANKLFNENPFERIMKETDQFFRASRSKKYSKKRHRPCDDNVTQSDIALCKEFLQKMNDIGSCFDYRDKGLRGCDCMQQLTDNDLQDASVFLVALGNQEKPLRDTQLKGMMASANQTQETKIKMKKKVWQAGLSVSDIEPDFQLPFGTQPNVCRQCFQFLFCLKPDTKWRNLRNSLTKDGPGPRKHGLIGNDHRKKHSGMGLCETDLFAFFELLVTDHGEPRATRLVRTKTKTGLRDTEIDLVELPSAMTKRGMYQRFCYERGYKVSSDAFGSYPKLNEYPARTDFDEVFWPPGSEPLAVCSWWSFHNYWKQQFPKLIVRSPSHDVCGECTIYRNRWKYGSSNDSVPDDEDAADDDDHDAEEGESKQDGAEDLENGAADLEDNADDDAIVTPAMLEQERLIADATRHVEQAIAMRELAQEKIARAQATSLLPHSERHYCFTVDYAQNLLLPNLGDTQPGDTYYFSPKNVYIFGIADNSKKPTTLVSYVYQEETGKKGAENVASMLYEFLDKQQILKEGNPAASLTIIADNCSGQNKNNTVLRLPLWLVERGFFCESTVLFLIRGHTKNACDRMFNIMKKLYHKTDTFTFAQLLKTIQVDGQVAILQATAETFIGWDDALKQFYTKFQPNTIFKNHIFSCFSTAPSTLIIKEWRDADIVFSRDFAKRGTKGPNRVQLMKEYQFQQLKEPGLREIKQVELYSKWRKFIPHQFHAEICPKPDDLVLQRIKNEKKEKLKLAAKKKKKKTEQSPTDSNLNTNTAMKTNELGTVTAMDNVLLS